MTPMTRAREERYDSGEGCNSNEEKTLLSPNVLTLAPFLSHRLGQLLCPLLDQLPGPGTTLRSHDARVVARSAHAAPHISPWLLLLLLLLLLWWSAPPSAVVGIVAWRVLLLRLHLAGRISRWQSPPGRRRSARGSLLHLHLRGGHAEGRPRGRLRVRGRLPLLPPLLEEMRRLAPSRRLGLRWWRPLEELRLRGRASSPLQLRRRRLPLVPRGPRRLLLLLLLPPRRGDPSSSSPPLSFGRGGSRPPLRRLLLLLLLLRTLLLLSRRLLPRDSLLLLLLLGRLVPLG